MLDNQPKRNNHKTYAAVTVMLVPSDYCLQLTVGSDWSAASRVPSESAVPHVQREPPSAGDLPEHAQHPLWRSLHCGGTVGCDPGGGVTPPLPPAVPGLGALLQIHLVEKGKHVHACWSTTPGYVSLSHASMQLICVFVAAF